jgi:hypothetical protein
VDKNHSIINDNMHKTKENIARLAKCWVSPTTPCHTKEGNTITLENGMP